MLDANPIVESIFLKVDKNGDVSLLFDDKVDHIVNVTDTMKQYTFIDSKNGVNIII